MQRSAGCSGGARRAGLHRLYVSVGRSARGQLNERDAERPDVRLAVVVVPEQHFWCHPVGCPLDRLLPSICTVPICQPHCLIHPHKCQSDSHNPKVSRWLFGHGMKRQVTHDNRREPLPEQQEHMSYSDMNRCWTPLLIPWVLNKQDAWL